MKKLIITVIAVFFIINVQICGQDKVFKPFKVDCGFTINVPTDDNAGTGAGFYIEPRYGVNEKLTLGLRLESDILSAGNISINFTSVKVNTTRIVPILITGDYYFSTENVRPFVGLGLGMYKKHINTVYTGIDGIDIGSTSKTNVGFAPRVGLNAKHFRLCAIYNCTGKEISDYLGIQFGIEFGGGRINK